MIVVSSPRAVGPPRRSPLVPGRPSRHARCGSSARQPPSFRGAPL